MADDIFGTGTLGGWDPSDVGDYGPGGKGGGGGYDWIFAALTDKLPTDALSWLANLAEVGEWYVPGAGLQTAGEWFSFLSTDQGKGWWGSLSDKSKETLQPDYNIAGGPGMFGAAQYGSTPKNPVLALPWLQGKTTLELPSKEHPYGYRPGGGYPTAATVKKKQAPSFLGGDKSIYREGLGAAPSRVAPPARWLLF